MVPEMSLSTQNMCGNSFQAQSVFSLATLVEIEN
jgi:hypothetical protein